MKTFAEDVWPEFTFYRYRLNLQPPLTLKSGRLAERQGILVRCERNDVTGWGEIAPLDGYNPETIAQVFDAILEVRRNLIDRRSAAHPMPSIQCGLEFALESFRAAGGKGSLYLQLGGMPELTHVPVARLIVHQEPDGAVATARQALADGFRVLKIKVGRRPLADDIGITRRIQAMLPAGAALRLDANRQWSLDEALEFSRSISSGGIDFIEEPLDDFSGYDRYDREQLLPFALDESLMEVEREAIGTWDRLSAVILKPTLLGGLSVADKWIAWAKDRKLKCVISSSFESGVGMRALIALAAARCIDTPAGLDTYSYLVDDVVSPRIKFGRGMAAIYQTFPKSWDVECHRLEEIR